MLFEKITSRKNKTVLDALALHEKRERDEKALFFTEGKKLLFEALEAGERPEKVFFTSAFLDKNDELLKELSDCELYPVTSEVYSKITDERAPEGVFAIFKRKEKSPLEKRGSVLLLEGVGDPGNLGTLIRCAIAFGARCVITVGTADPYSPKSVRASMGGIFKIPVIISGNIDDAIALARELSDKVVATALHSDSVTLDEVDTSQATIMIGSEGSGLSSRAIELSDIKAIIPIENIESLNASVAGAIALFDSMQKRRGK